MSSGPILTYQSPLLCKPQQFFFSACLRAVYYSDAALWTPLLNAAGTYILYQSSFAPGQYPYWFMADYGSAQLIVIAGTSNADQWVGNILGTAQAMIAPWPGQINAYFGTTANATFTNLSASVGAGFPWQNVVIVGHSLGGATANLLAYELEINYPGCVSWVYTEGCPRIGNAEWAAGPTWPILAWRNTGDIVPLVPPLRGNQPSWIADQIAWGPCEDYYPVGDVWFCNTGGGIFTGTVGHLVQTDWGVLAQFLSQGVNANALSHATGAYAQRIYNWSGKAMGLVPKVQLGIDMPIVAGWQQTFGFTGDGFVWSP